MDPSYRIVPATQPKSASLAGTTNAQGLHDTLSYGPRSLATEQVGTSGLQGRLEGWHATQDNLKLTMHRAVYGVHAPVRLMMERKIVSRNPHMPTMPQSNLHLDILMGRDEELDTMDFMGAPVGPMSMDIHKDMERKLRM